MAEINLHESKAYSEHGEDGIVEFLFGKLGLSNGACAEFGLGGTGLKGCNTAKLVNEGWRGLFIDASLVFCLKAEEELILVGEAQVQMDWITKDNINELVPPGEEWGLISVDVDGMDYWIFKAMDSMPAVFIVEYNETFGDKMIAVPYAEDFNRGKLSPYPYCGASLPLMVRLAKEKGYRFVGAESRATNAFFVREDLAKGLEEASVEEALTFSTPPNVTKTHGTRAQKWEKVKDKEFACL